MSDDCACVPFVKVCTGSGTTLYDPFTRTVANGWGTSPPGTVWTRFTGTGAPASDWSVNGSSGVISGTGSHSSNIDLPFITTEVYIEAQLIANSAAPSGSDIFFFVLNVPGDFGMELDFATNGNLEFTTNTDDILGTAAFAPTVPFAVRFQCDGTNGRVRLWKLSDPEPVTWDFTGTMAGEMNHLGAGTQMAGTFTAHWDNFGVEGLPLDTFDNRTIGAGTASWGTSSSGAVWTRFGGSIGRSAVTGGEGYMMCAAGFTSQQEFERITSGFTPIEDFDCLVHLRLFDTATSLPDSVNAFVIFSFAGLSWGWERSGPDIFLQDPLSGPTTLPVSATFWGSLSAGAYMRVQRQANTARLKLWDDTLGEPGWQLAAGVATGQFITEQVEGSFNGGGASNDTHGIAIDVIVFADIGTVDCTTPSANQPIQDELDGLGDNTTVIFYTNYPYNPQSLEVEVDGFGVDVDPTDWKSGKYTVLTTAPTSPLEVRSSYLRSEF